eukprot:1136703-Pelagomonas_calceolata.AAC.6
MLARTGLFWHNKAREPRSMQPERTAFHPEYSLGIQAISPRSCTRQACSGAKEEESQETYT